MIFLSSFTGQFSRLLFPSFVIVLIAVAVCEPSLGHAQDRRWLPPPTEVARHEDTDGDLFGSPMFIEGSPDGGWVMLDWGDMSVRKFTADAELVWKSGREGQGPGEFKRMMDVEYDSSGNVLVLDLENSRITIISPTGEHIDDVRVPAGEADVGGMLPRSFDPGNWPLVARDAADLWVSFIDGETSVHRRIAAPPELALPGDNGESGADIAGEGWASHFPDLEGGALIAYRWSSKLVFLDRTGGVQRIIEGPEVIPFPEPMVVEIPGFRGYKVDPEGVQATLAADVGEGGVFVLFLGASEDAGRIVDTYSRSGVYEGSFLLPEEVRAFRITALGDDKIALLDNSFFPTVWVFDVERGPLP